MAIGTIWDGCECELQCFQYYISQTSLSITPNLDKYVIHSMRNLKKLQYESWATGALLRPLLQVLRVGGSEESEWVGATQNDSSLLPTLGRGIFVVPIYRCNWFFLVLQNGRTLWKFLAWVVAWSFRNIAARMETDCESLVTCSGKTKFRFFKIEKTGVKTWRWRSLGKCWENMKNGTAAHRVYHVFVQRSGLWQVLGALLGILNQTESFNVHLIASHDYTLNQFELHQVSTCCLKK